MHADANWFDVVFFCAMEAKTDVVIVIALALHAAWYTVIHLFHIKQPARSLQGGLQCAETVTINIDLSGRCST